MGWWSPTRRWYGAKLQGVRTKNRLTVYYLLAEQLGKLDVLT